jgi:hypothetical protein
MGSPFPHAPPPQAGMSKTSVAVLFLLIGLGAGFLLGLGATQAGSAVLEAFMTSEAPADVAHAKSYARPGFSFKYPGNWKVDVEDKDHDPDHFLTVESPGSCMIMLIVFDTALAPEDMVQKQVDAFVPKLLSSPARTPITTWGKYSGTGVLLKGKILSINPGAVRIFSHANEKRSFVTVEQCYDEDIKDVQPGLDLISSSFDFTP